VFVTGSLFALSLPPTLPIWMAMVGAAFGVTFGKMVFGGFGKNVFNPALTGRAFIYVSFGAHMTATWGMPVPGVLGGLAAYAPDAITQATPGMQAWTGEHYSILQLFLGRVPGTLGGTCALLAILGGLYLIKTKAANFRIVVGGFIGFFVVHSLLWLTGAGDPLSPLRVAFAGNLVFGLFFYATDPVSGPKTNEVRWLYGGFIGAMTSLIAVFSAWPAGTMFAILLANMFAPISDYAVKEWQKKQKAKTT
jgi:Na+-transporting NADH:ubiquinone oxidoreductase subunit B